jgi:hypothetical protein
MHLNLKRIYKGLETTIGQLFINGAQEFDCWTLEDVVRPEGEPKVYGKTAIPKGRYEVVITMSNRFKQPMPLLKNVPGFEGIRIHPGNKAGDTDGCILVGRSRVNDDFIGESRLAYIALFQKLDRALARGEHVDMDITE